MKLYHKVKIGRIIASAMELLALTWWHFHQMSYSCLQTCELVDILLATITHTHVYSINIKPNMHSFQSKARKVSITDKN